MALLMVLVGSVALSTAAAADLPVPPHLSAAGRADFAAYLEAGGSKAMAIAPGGAWGWVADQPSAAVAQAQALARCAENTEQTCVPYAVDARRVFDEKKWATLWRLLPAQGATGVVGLQRGARFPDLIFADAGGKQRRLSEWRGNVAVLHFWGSWCGPCRHELPDLATSAKLLSGSRVVFIPLQVRESFAVSRQWVERQGIALTLFDSGMVDAASGTFRIAGGGSLPDRAVAPVFPSSVVLDRDGRVVFVHHGPIERWSEYRPQLRDLAR